MLSRAISLLLLATKVIIFLYRNGFAATYKKAKRTLLIKIANRSNFKYRYSFNATNYLAKNCSYRKDLKVSVIVPNYNHAKFLLKRLDAIYHQTYKNFEVILMDDCSSDESLEILHKYYELYPDITRLIINKENSGGVFRQWSKGVSLAKGDLVWIAESDDYCELNFLENMVDSFYDESMMLAFSKTIFVDDYEKQIWSTEKYLKEIHSDRWQRSYTNTGFSEVCLYFSKINIIPNASSCVFRRPLDGGFLSEEQWLQMKICGDWVLYLYLLLGGRISYCSETANYYRIHQKNTSVSNFKKDIYYKELEIVAQYLMKLYNLPPSILKSVYEKAKKDWLLNRENEPLSDLDQIYVHKKIESCGKEYKPVIAMCGFSFASGGGETFPIRLANILKKKGYAVFFLNFNYTERNEKIREMLRADIPLINVNDWWEAKKILVLHGCDIVHSHHASLDVLISDLNLPRYIKHVVTTHGMYEGMAEEYQKINIPKLFKTVSHWVYTAEKNLHAFKKFPEFKNQKFIKIGNGVEYVATQAHKREEFSIDKHAFVVCLVSRAIVEKGWTEAIEIISKVRNITKKDVQLILIGDGPVYDQLREKVPSYIHCLGFREDINAYYGMSDVGFLPSYFSGESFPLVVIDSLVVGKPVIASDIGEIKNMLTLPSGEIAGDVFTLNNMKIPIDDVVEIMSRYVLDKKYLAHKENVVREAAKKFSLDEVILHYEQVYKKVHLEVDIR
jgi:O-antigen biosynthesis protein